MQGANTAAPSMVQTIAICAMTLVIPFSGWLSDRYGRKPVLLSSTLATVAFGSLAGMVAWLCMHEGAHGALLRNQQHPRTVKG